MSSTRNKSFISGVIKHVHDCSNPMQLGIYLKRYESYVFTPEIQEVFKSRIEFFKHYFAGDRMMLERCEDLEDVLETEIQIANVCSTDQLANPMASDHSAQKILRSHQQNINISHLEPEESILETDLELELLRQVFNMTNGNKVIICRILQIDNNFLNKKIKQYRLKSYLNEIRKKFRSKSVYTKG